MPDTTKNPMQHLPFRLEEDLSNLDQLTALLKNNMLLVNERSFNTIKMLEALVSTPPQFRPGHAIVIKDPLSARSLYSSIDPIYPAAAGFSLTFADDLLDAFKRIDLLRDLVQMASGVRMDLVVVDFGDSNLIGELREAGYAPKEDPRPILEQYVEDELKPRREAKRLAQIRELPLVKPEGLRVNMIVATDTDRAIGKGNALPWKHKGDMKCFRKTTTGNIVVMGRKTFESMGSKPLPNRHNIVLTSSLHHSEAPLPPGEDIASGTTLTYCKTIADALTFAARLRGVLLSIHKPDPALFVIGGESLYKAFMPLTDVIYHNMLDLKVTGADAWFPEIGQDEWLMNHVIRRPENGDDVSWREQVYVRRS